MADGYTRSVTFPLNVYLASRVGRRDELMEYAEQIQKQGHEVVSEWLWTPGDGKTQSEYAAMCEANIWSSDVMLQFTEHPETQANGAGRGGRHVELGLAFAQNKTIYLVGPTEHDFHHLMNIGIFKEWSPWILLMLDAEKSHKEARTSNLAHSRTVAQCGICLAYEEDRDKAGEKCPDGCLTEGGRKAKMRRRSGDICYVCRTLGKEDFYTQYDRLLSLTTSWSTRTQYLIQMPESDGG